MSEIDAGVFKALADENRLAIAGTPRSTPNKP